MTTWLAPLKAVGLTRNTMEGVGSMDTVERLDPKELRQTATVMAWVALKAANDANPAPRLN